MSSPEDKDARLPADLEEELDRNVHPGLAAALKKSYAGLREHAPAHDAQDADAGTDGEYGVKEDNGEEGRKEENVAAPGNGAVPDGEAGGGDGGKFSENEKNKADKEDKEDKEDKGTEAAVTGGDGGDGGDGGGGNGFVGGTAGGSTPARAGGDEGGGNGSGGDNDDNDNADEEDEEEEEEDNTPMTLRDHLVEMRSRLFKSFLWLLAGFCLSWPWNEKLFALIFAPLAAVMPEGAQIVYLSPPEAFFVYMKVCLATGFFLTSPMIFYQVWAFIAPGLYKEEKLFILPAAVSSAVLFLCGVIFCYAVVFDAAFRFFMSYDRGMVHAMLDMDETLSFVLRFLLAFGLIFELPLFIFFLSRVGLVTADMLRRFRRYAVLGAVILGALLTPPDVISQVLMAGPLIVLYEIGIVIALLFGKKKKNNADETAEKDDDGEDEADGESGASSDAPVPNPDLPPEPAPNPDSPAHPAEGEEHAGK